MAWNDRQHAPGLFAVVGQHGNDLCGEAALIVRGVLRVRLARTRELGLVRHRPQPKRFTWYSRRS